MCIIVDAFKITLVLWHRHHHRPCLYRGAKETTQKQERANDDDRETNDSRLVDMGGSKKKNRDDVGTSGLEHDPQTALLGSLNPSSANVPPQGTMHGMGNHQFHPHAAAAAPPGHPHPPPHFAPSPYATQPHGDSNFAAAGNMYLNANTSNNNAMTNNNYNTSQQQGGGMMLPQGGAGYPPQHSHPQPWHQQHQLAYHQMPPQHQMQQHMPPPQMQQQHPPPIHPTPQQQHLNDQHQQQLRLFWQQQMTEVESATDFKNHQLPLARIKKIMKTDEDVRMISSEAPVLFAKACEMFILELTLRSWIHSEENKRRTLQRNDIAIAITKTDIFDFLVDIVPRDDGNGGGNNAAVIAAAAAAAAAGQQQQQQQQRQQRVGIGGGSLTIGMGGGSAGLKLEEPKAMRGGIQDVKHEEPGTVVAAAGGANGTGIGGGVGNITDASYNAYPLQPQPTLVASDVPPPSQQPQQDGVKKEGGGQDDAVPLI